MIYVDVACKNCGTVRKVVKYNRQPDLCRRCSYDSRSLGRVKLKCVGYTIYGVNNHATNCPHEAEKKRKTLKFYGGSKGVPQTTDDGEHAFINAERSVYRCKWCAGALFLLRKMERDVKQFCKKMGETVPKIQTINDLIRERKRISNQSVVHEDEKTGAVTIEVFDPHSFAHNENKRKWGPRSSSVAQQTGLLIQRSKNAAVVKGLCRFCDKIVFSNKGGKASTVTVHAKCYQDHKWDQDHQGVPPPLRSRGGQVALENLRKHYSWAMRHNLGGESYGEIAKEYGVARETIKNGIEFIAAHLPEPEIVGKEFRDRITRLKSPQPIQPYTSSTVF